MIGAPRSEYHLLSWRLRDTLFVVSYVALVAAVLSIRWI